MKYSSLLLIFILVISISSSAIAEPVLSADVSVSGGYKYYTYTLTGGNGIVGLSIYMPEAGARSIVESHCSKDNWTSGPSLRGDWTHWVLSGTALANDEILTLSFTTADSVPTSNTLCPSGIPSNWHWIMRSNDGYGSYNVPVPVPEPGSLAAFSCGLLGIGGLMMRRRR